MVEEWIIQVNSFLKMNFFPLRAWLLTKNEKNLVLLEQGTQPQLYYFGFISVS